MIRDLYQKRLARFIGVGVINTIIDFSLFNVFIVIGMPVIVGGLLATSIAIAISYVLNGNAVFKDKDLKNTPKVIRFLIITFIGVYIIQYLILYVMKDTSRNVLITIFLHIPLLSALAKTHADFLVLNVSKTVGVVASTSWNYVMYKRYVFTEQEDEEA